jgi:hypothetical protein
MQFLNIFLVMLMIPSAVFAVVICRGEATKTVRAASGSAAMLIFSGVVTFFFEAIISAYSEANLMLYSADNRSYLGLRLPALALIVCFFIVGIFCCLRTAKKKNPAVTFALSAGLAAVWSAATALACYFATGSDYYNLTLPAIGCFFIFAVFFAAELVLDFDTKLTKIMLITVNILFALTILILLLAAYDVGLSVLSSLGTEADGVSVAIAAVIFAVIAAPAAVSVFSLVGRQITVFNQNKK